MEHESGSKLFSWLETEEALYKMKVMYGPKSAGRSSSACFPQCQSFGPSPFPIPMSILSTNLQSSKCTPGFPGL